MKLLELNRAFLSLFKPPSRLGRQHSKLIDILLTSLTLYFAGISNDDAYRPQYPL